MRSRLRWALLLEMCFFPLRSLPMLVRNHRYVNADLFGLSRNVFDMV